MATIATPAGGRTFQLPPAIAPLAGRINDFDAHDAIPINHWADTYGQVASDFVRALSSSGHLVAAERDADDTPITEQNVLQAKMEQAPGAFDFGRRLEVMDFMGYDRQILFPGNMALFAHAFRVNADDPTYLPALTGDRKRYATSLIGLYNDWCARVGAENNRFRPVGLIIEDSVEAMMVTLRSLADRGVRLVTMPVDAPPAGFSPAHPALDPFWAFAADAGIGIIAHIGVEMSGLFKSTAWRNAPAFQGWRIGAEIALDPWTTTGLHLPVQNFLGTMILGGVFDRHPALRFGAAEYCGHWVGPLAENMDRWIAYTPFARFNTGEGIQLQRKPSEYFPTNVRVSLFDFEEVGTYINRYGFEDVYCFASDYPHFEGGRDTINSFMKNIDGQPSDILEKFFVTNARMFAPD